MKDLPDVQALLGQVRDYLGRLRQLDLDDGDVLRHVGPWEIAGKCALRLLDALVWAPLAIPGLILQGPVALVIGLVGAKISPRKDVIGTTKLMMGLVLVPLLHACVITLIGWQFGWPWAVGVAVALPLSGWAALRALETGLRVWEMLETAGRIAVLRRELSALRQTRDRLQDEVVRLVDKYRPADMVLLFERPAPNEP